MLRVHSRFDRRQRGFTLAEILVTTAIFAIIMIAALTVYDMSNKVFKSSTESADMQQSTRVGFEKLVSDVRMAGFDYNRGGTPTEAWQAPQPDEQIEYAGSTALVFRANFNYNTAAAQGNGLEPAYTPVNVNNEAIFPYVTTSNDEIVAYVLRSDNAAANTGSIFFYADVSKPRSAFPSTLTPAPAPGNPSAKESKVTISGIDTTNANPPYTLYRVSVTDVQNNALGTPVAENIRSLNFIYYTDTTGTTSLKDSTGATIPAGCVDPNCTGAIGGDGQYDPNAPGFAGAGTFADRAQRAQIQSIRISLVGMNSSPDLQGYTNPTETIGAIKNYREYALSSLVVPRNLGKTGFPEPVNNPPAPPQIVDMCTGYCGAPVIYWTPPTGGGPVLQYLISWDTSPNGAFAPPHSVTVSDPTATSYVLPDDGLSNLSLTWYYRIQAINDNGASSPSNLFTAVPHNNTKPNPPSNFVATDNSLGNAQPGQISLSWTAPSQNDPSLNTLSCAGGTGSTNGQTIPSAEIIHYRIWRGTRADFDPTPGCGSGPQCQGVAVLRLASGSQPPAVSPGSTVTWVDNAANEQLPQGGQSPAACTQYYYRIQAVNRCVLNSTYEASGNTNDSASTFFPPINGSTNAVPGSVANTTTTPQAPVGLQVNTTGSNSGCPDPSNPSSPNCRITLIWSPVTNDTSGNAIGVDTYQITRSVKHQNNIPSNGYTPDPTFGTAGVMNVSGFSQMAPDPTTGKLTWVDTTGLVADPGPNFPGSLYSYQYTVAAVVCGKVGAASNAVQYPTPCSINPTIVQAGASNSSSTADTPSTAWIMGTGDTITVTPPVGVTFATVNFSVTAWPSGTPADNQTVGSPGPYVYTWGSLTSGQIYTVTITIVEATPTAGCTEVHIKYVQEQTPAPCAVANVALPLPAPTLATSGSTTTATQAFTITNSGSDPLEFNIISGAGSPFQSTFKETWSAPSPPTFSDMSATAFIYSYGAYNSSDNFSLTTSPISRGVPATLPNVTAGTSLTFTLHWVYKKTDGTLTTSPLSKLCIAYKIPSEPTTVKYCNVVGQSATTNNPNACD